MFLCSGCLKEKLDPESITGTWQYDEVQFLGNSADSIVKFPGTFSFKKSTSTYNAGGTVYGDFCDGSGDFPALSQRLDGPSYINMFTIDFKLTKAQEPSNYNFRDFYSGVYGYLYQGTNDYGPIRMCLISDNEMNIQLQRSQNSGTRFNILNLKLKKK